MTNNFGIALLGLGPGDPKLVTRQAWCLLEESQEVYLRTRQHPVVASFPSHLRVHSFDDLYESNENFEVVYSQIVDKVLLLGGRPEGVVFAVPGHPYVAEVTGPEIIRRARQQNIPVRVYEGLSFLEPVCTALNIDPFPQTALVDALEMAIANVPSFPTSAPAIIAQIYSRTIAAEVKLTLMALYPDEHPVKLVHAAGTSGEFVEELQLFEIDRSSKIGLLTSLYVPPLGPTTSFEAFQELIAHLRAPDGCPWDREQTHKSLRPYLLEETYEVLETMDAEDPSSMREELGDLLLQIVLHAQIAAEEGEFTMADILHSIHTKIVYRHPHVFDDLRLTHPKGVLINWERLKAEERAQNGKEAESLLDGIAAALPALVQAEEYQNRAVRVGFDWLGIGGVLDKLKDEIEKAQTATASEERFSEIGDLLFAIVNFARSCGIDAESALRTANARFRNRFQYIEKWACSQEREITDFSLNEMEALWQEAKRIEKSLRVK